MCLRRFRDISFASVRLLSAPLILSFAGCMTFPTTPNERTYPIRQIMGNALCELRDTFIALNDKRSYPKFSADIWAASIQLTPKADANISIGVGFSGNNRGGSADSKFWSWSFLPGAGVNVKGHNDASVTYVTHSKALVENNLDWDEACNKLFSSRKARGHYLGILEWWERSIPLGHAQLSRLASIKRASFNQNITVKFSAGSGSAVYSVLPHTLKMSGSGNYILDVLFVIAHIKPQENEERANDRSDKYYIPRYRQSA